MAQSLTGRTAFKEVFIRRHCLKASGQARIFRTLIHDRTDRAGHLPQSTPLGARIESARHRDGRRLRACLSKKASSKDVDAGTYGSVLGLTMEVP
jgi:hypothetical protein